MTPLAPTSPPRRRRDVLFAVFCLTLLGGVLWVSVHDYNRDWRAAQRLFHEVEAVRSERAMLEAVPEDLDEYHQVLADVRVAREVVQKARVALKGDDKSAVQRDKVLAVDATVELTERDESGKVTKTEKKTYPARIIDDRVVFAVPESDGSAEHILLREMQDGKLVPVRSRVSDPLAPGVQVTLARAESALAVAEGRFTTLTAALDRYARATVEADTPGGPLAALPLFDAFTAPSHVRQIDLPERTSDRPGSTAPSDRCTTCHLGIDRADYGKAVLEGLRRPPEGAQRKLRTARSILEARRRNGEDLGFDPGKLPRKVRSLALTQSQVAMFAAHPRLDLFVGPDSPHRADKFGCTLCHAGQSSAVDFTQAAHTPDDTAQQKQWQQEHHWRGGADEGGMLPGRFVESSCLKCHHQITDLVRDGVKKEAPKLLQGYALVRDLGCVGCHDVNGFKDGRPVGPDLRLEPSPALDLLPAAAQARAQVDPNAPPGTQRKVGPGLRRLAEKTDEEWVKRWLLAPRGFRPDTRMPHFYNLGTITPEALAGTGQEKFPDAEINAIASYLHQESERSLKGEDFSRLALQQQLDLLQTRLIDAAEQGTPLPEKEIQDLDAVTRAFADLALLAVPLRALAINDLVARQQHLQGRLKDAARAQTKARPLADELKVVTAQLLRESVPTPIRAQLVDSEGRAVELPPDGREDEEVRARGRNLFTEKGCLACHAHEGTTKALKTGELARATSEAHFGPNLSRLAGKLRGEQGRLWLIQWLLNPNVHHARTRMPVTWLTTAEAGDIADWLLTQPDPALDAVRIQIGRVRKLTETDIDTDEKDKAKSETERQERAADRQALDAAVRDLIAHCRAWTPYNAAVMAQQAEELERALAELIAELEAFDSDLAALEEAVRGKQPTEKLQQTLAGRQKALLKAADRILGGKKQEGGDNPSLAGTLFQMTAQPFPTSDEATLRQLARVYLAKAPGISGAEVEQFLPADPKKKGGIPPGRLDRPDADEHALEGPVTADKLKWYIGRKSVGRLACYGCHDVPGFESARPASTGLGDWGRKDPRKLNFGGGVGYVRDNYHLTPSRATRRDLDERIRKLDRPARIRELEARGQTDAKLLDEERVELRTLLDQGPLTDEEKRELRHLRMLRDREPWAARDKDGKPPFEKWYFEGLEAHDRVGFLNLELADPRAFDHGQARAWDERLRMPQFQFARGVKRLPGETDEAFADRASREEADAREAAMTFVLGLVAEPVSLAYLNRPNADKQAEARGRVILEKYNCAGCHVVRPGRYDLKPSSETLGKLVERYKPDPGDFPTLGHNAWTGKPSRPGHLTAFGTPFPNGKLKFNGRDPTEEGRPLVVRLTEALRVRSPEGVTVDIPAGEEVRLPYGELRVRDDPEGGAFVENLFAYVRKKHPEEQINSPPGDDNPTEDRNKARNFLPPPLLREGERVQPDWLYQFLLNPQVIRPYTILRMPRFNLSPSESRDLVDYFNGVDRSTNPGSGLPPTYAVVPQHEEGFWDGRNARYLERLKQDNALAGRLLELRPSARLVLQDRQLALTHQIELMTGSVEAEKKASAAALARAQADLTAAKDPKAKEEAEKTLKATEEAVKKANDPAHENLARAASLEKARKELEGDAALKGLDEEYQQKAYAADGYRLLMGHGGNICLSCHQIGNLGTPGQAPRLDRVSGRLRPEWLEHWIARPSRMLAYSPKMNANFQHGERTSQNLLVGSSEEQIIALRDVLLHYPRVADLPVNRYFAVPARYYQDATPKEVPK